MIASAPRSGNSDTILKRPNPIHAADERQGASTIIMCTAGYSLCQRVQCGGSDLHDHLALARSGLGELSIARWLSKGMQDGSFHRGLFLLVAQILVNSVYHR